MAYTILHWRAQLYAIVRNFLTRQGGFSASIHVPLMLIGDSSLEPGQTLCRANCHRFCGDGEHGVGRDAVDGGKAWLSTGPWCANHCCCQYTHL
jgi:hypothetical protein